MPYPNVILLDLSRLNVRQQNSKILAHVWQFMLLLEVPVVVVKGIRSGVAYEAPSALPSTPTLERLFCGLGHTLREACKQHRSLKKQKAQNPGLPVGSGRNLRKPPSRL